MTDPYVGSEGVLTGAARLAQEARERSESLIRAQTNERRQRDLVRKRATTERQVSELRAALEAEENEALMLTSQETGREETLASDRFAMASKRGVGK